MSGSHGGAGGQGLGNVLVTNGSGLSGVPVCILSVSYSHSVPMGSILYGRRIRGNQMTVQEMITALQALVDHAGLGDTPVVVTDITGAVSDSFHPIERVFAPAVYLAPRGRTQAYVLLGAGLSLRDEKG